MTKYNDEAPSIHYGFNMDNILKDKVVLVTGGTTGIGRATAKLLLENGAKVMIFGRHERELNDAVLDFNVPEGNSAGIIADVSKREDIKKVFKIMDEKFGRIDILVNNASLPARSIVQSEYEEWEYVLKVNILGYMHCAHEAILRMKKQGGGHIVNMGSMSAKVKEEDADLYVATKSAVEGFSESLRKQINKSNIKVSVIEPGSVGTSMVLESPKEQEKLQRELIMLKAEDIAEAILFCLTRPKRCDVICLEIKPHHQFI